MSGKRRLFWRIYPFYLLIILLSLMMAVWYASRTIQGFFLETTMTDLKARAGLMEHPLLALLEPFDREGLRNLVRHAGRIAQTRITVILPNGTVIADSEQNPEAMDNHADRPEVLSAMRGMEGASIRESLTIQQKFLYVALPIVRDGETLAIVRTAVPIHPLEGTLNSLQNRIVLVGLLIALLCAPISWWVARRITRPIETLRKWAESIVKGEKGLRPSVEASEEMEALSKSLSRMQQDLHDRLHQVVRQRNEMEAVLSSMVEGVIALDMRDRIIGINQAGARMFGCDMAESKGRSIQEVVRNSLLHDFVQGIRTSPQPLERDIPLTPDGEALVNVHGTGLLDPAGQRIGVLLVLNDVSRLRRLENIRREFVANVSHEIKTPITAIKGFVETLRESEGLTPEDNRRFLEIIGRHANRLEALVEDLLKLSRVEREAERGEIHLQVRPIQELLQTAIQICRAKAEKKAIQVDILCPPGLQANVDPPLLEQAVVNLLDNAIQYSEAGSNVGIHAVEANAEIRISVSDHGVGIEKKHLSRLFERFYRVDKARSRQLGGTGLGLAIVKHIVQAHGGRLSVESAPGKGSTFTIHLPKIESDLPS